jgi:hypothetical protein
MIGYIDTINFSLPTLKGFTLACWLFWIAEYLLHKLALPELSWGSFRSLHFETSERWNAAAISLVAHRSSMRCDQHVDRKSVCATTGCITNMHLYATRKICQGSPELLVGIVLSYKKARSWRLAVIGPGSVQPCEGLLATTEAGRQTAPLSTKKEENYNDEPPEFKRAPSLSRQSMNQPLSLLKHRTHYNIVYRTMDKGACCDKEKLVEKQKRRTSKSNGRERTRCPVLLEGHRPFL